MSKLLKHASFRASIIKTNLEKGLRKLRGKDLIGLALSTGTTKVFKRVDFQKA